MSANASDGRAGLTRLTRLAQHQPEHLEHLVALIERNLPHSIGPAIEVALETGAPMPEAIMHVLERSTSAEVAEAVAGRLPIHTVPELQAAAISALERLLADASWPGGEETALRRASLRIALSARRLAEGEVDAAEELVRAALAALDRLPGDEHVLTRRIEAHDLLMEIAGQRGEAERAVAEAREALRLREAADDRWEPIGRGRLHLGAALVAAGRPEEGVEEFVHALAELREALDRAVAAFAALEPEDRTAPVWLEETEREDVTGFRVTMPDLGNPPEVLHTLLVDGAVRLIAADRPTDASLLELDRTHRAVVAAGAMPEWELLLLDSLHRVQMREEREIARSWGELAADLGRVATTLQTHDDPELSLAGFEAQIACLAEAADDDPTELINALQDRVKVLTRLGRAQEVMDALQLLNELTQEGTPGYKHRGMLLHNTGRRLGELGLADAALGVAAEAAEHLGKEFLGGSHLDAEVMTGTLLSLVRRAREAERPVPPSPVIAETVAELLRRAVGEPRGTVPNLGEIAGSILVDNLEEPPGDDVKELYRALAELADHHPEVAIIQRVRGHAGSLLSWRARLAGDFDAAFGYYREVAAAARALPEENELALEQAICAVDLLGVLTESGDDDALAARLAADMLEAVSSPEYLAARARDVGDDPAQFLASIEHWAARHHAAVAERAEIDRRCAALLLTPGEVPIVGQVAATELGSAPDPASARELHVPDGYIARDLDAELDAALARPGLTVVAGARGAGRRRTLLEALARNARLAALELLAPRDATALDALLGLRARVDDAYVLWLGELDAYDPGALKLPDDATAVGVTSPEDVERWRGVTVVELPLTLSEPERERLMADGCPRPIAEEIARSGFGPAFAVADAVLARYGVDDAAAAIARAAVDWRRAGIRRPVSRERLRSLARHYGVADGFSQALQDALAASLLRELDAGLAPSGWLLGADSRELDPDAWEECIAAAEPEDALSLAAAAEDRGRRDLVERACRLGTRSADLELASWAGSWLGELLAKAGDFDAAIEAYEAVIAAGHPDLAPSAATQAGLRLKAAAPSRARALFERAVAFGHPDHSVQAAFNLAGLLVENGEFAEAEALYVDVVASGHEDQTPKAQANIGILRERSGDREGAEAAYRRALATDHPVAAPQAAIRLGRMLAAQQDVEGASAAFEQAIALPDAAIAAQAAFELGHLLREAGRRGPARAAYEQTIASGDAELAPRAAYILGVMLDEAGDRGGARTAYRQAIALDRGSIRVSALNRLGILLAKDGAVDEALELFTAAADAGDADGYGNLGVLRFRLGDLEGARSALVEASRRGNDTNHELLADLGRSRPAR